MPAVCPSAVSKAVCLLNQNNLFEEVVLIYAGAPARTRTWNNGSEDRYDIRFTTGALQQLFLSVVSK